MWLQHRCMKLRGVHAGACRISLSPLLLRIAGWDLRSSRVLCRLVASERDAGHCTWTMSVSSGRVKWSKVEGEEEERNQPSSASCWITAIHAPPWPWTDAPSVDGCSLEALLLLSYSSLLLREQLEGKSSYSWEKQEGCLTQNSLEWVLPQISYPAEIWGSSNEGHLGRATLSPMAPGAGRGYVRWQSVPAQDIQKGVWACSMLVFKKDGWQCSLNWLSVCTDFLEMWPLFIQLFLWHCGEGDYRGRRTSKETFWRAFCRWLYFALTAGWFWWPRTCFLSCDTVILHDHGWYSLLFPTWSIQLLSCSVTQEAVYAKTAAPAEIWHQRRRNFIPLDRKPCVNLGVAGRNILVLSCIRTVNDVSSEWWVTIVSCIQILISQDYGYNQ